jgi:hypothetical protein
MEDGEDDGCVAGGPALTSSVCLEQLVSMKR